MADPLCFPLPPSSSPGLQCRSWPSLLSGPTTGSGYLVICIHTLMVQYIVIAFLSAAALSSCEQDTSLYRSLNLSLYPFVSFFLPSGDFVFALSSDDNSELWLSADDSPLNVHLLAWVGKVHTCGAGPFPHITCNIHHHVITSSLWCLFACGFSFYRLAWSGQPPVSLRSMPVRPPDRFGELTANYILLSEKQLASTTLLDVCSN